MQCVYSHGKLADLADPSSGHGSMHQIYLCISSKSDTSEPQN